MQVRWFPHDASIEAADELLVLTDDGRPLVAVQRVTAEHYIVLEPKDANFAATVQRLGSPPAALFNLAESIFRRS